MAYATTEDLEAYLGDGVTLPGNAATLLDRASVYVDDILIGAFYQVDGDGNPTDPDVAEALKQATCAQVQYWSETGNASGVEGADDWGTVSIGNVSLSRTARTGSGSRSGGSTTTTFSPDAIRYLRLAGLLPIAPWVYG